MAYKSRTDQTLNEQAEKLRTLENDMQIRRTQYRGREYTRECDGRWVDDWGNQLLVADDGSFSIKEAETDPWVTHSLARWEDSEIGDDGWFLDEWVPIGQIVSLYGRPGARKSTLLLQWMIAGSIGAKFGNSLQPLAYGPTYGLFCEDNERQIAKRARAMLKHYGKSFRDMSDCHAESLVLAHMTEFVTFRRSGVMDTTPAWAKFQRDLDRLKPVFVCLDVAADFFGGDEIRRRESSQFLRLLDRTADERRCAMVFSAHPSVRGIRDRSLTSGNTGWEGKVRARLTLEDPSDHDRDDDDDPVFNQSDQRTLTLAKANYAKNGAEMKFVIRDGVFIPEDLDPNNKKSTAADSAAADAAFLDRLRARLDKGLYVSPNRGNSASYAPSELAGNGFTTKTLEAAMRRLFDRGQLKFVAKNKGVDKWVIAAPT